MPELEEINTRLSSGEIKNYKQQFKPIILGNWKPVRPQEGLRNVWQKLCENPYYASHPIYLALPNSMIPEYLESEAQNGVVVGSRSMVGVSAGNFTESIAVKLLAELGTRFVVLDTQEVALTSAEPFKEVNEKVRHLLNDNLYAFVVLGESHAEHMEGLTFNTLTTQLEAILNEVPEEHLKNLSLVYSPSWTATQGMTGLEDNINKSYFVFRHKLEKILGEEKACKVRVMISAPHIFGSCFPYLKNSQYDGFYFSSIAVQTRSFLETCADFEKQAPDVLETQRILSDDVLESPEVIATSKEAVDESEE